MFFVIVILFPALAGVVIGLLQKPDAAKVARWAAEDEARLDRIAAGRSGRAYNRNAVIAAVGFGMMGR